MARISLWRSAGSALRPWRHLFDQGLNLRVDFWTPGVGEDDEILEIHCELRDGDKALHPSKQGDFIRLSEHLSQEAQRKEIVASAL